MPICGHVRYHRLKTNNWTLFAWHVAINVTKFYVIDILTSLSLPLCPNTAVCLMIQILFSCMMEKPERDEVSLLLTLYACLAWPNKCVGTNLPSRLTYTNSVFCYSWKVYMNILWENCRFVVEISVTFFFGGGGSKYKFYTRIAT